MAAAKAHVRVEVPRALSGGSVGTGNSETQPAEIVSHGASLVLHLSDLLCALISFALYAKQQTIIILDSADAHVCVCELYSRLCARYVSHVPCLFVFAYKHMHSA